MEDSKYKLLIENAPFGFAHYKIITNDSGTPVDYECIEVNQAFEKLMGPNIATSANIATSDCNWISLYGELALNNGAKEFEYYSETLDRWYKVQAYSYEKFYFTTVFTDITKDKKQAQELENFFSVNLDLLCIADDQYNFIKLNSEWENVLGYRVEELLNKGYIQYIHPDDITATKNVVSKLRNHEKVLNFTNRYRCKDGMYRYIEWRAHPCGNIVYASARDVTEHKYLQDKLMLANQQLRQIIDLVPVKIFAKDDGGRYIMANKAIADFFEMTPEELAGKNVEECGATKAQIEKSLEADTYVIESGEPLFIPEQQISKKDGTTRWFQTTKVPYKHPGCEKLAVLGVSTDITERKMLEEKLKKSNDHFKKLFNLSPVMKAIIKDNRCVQVNQAWLDHTGYSIDETLYTGVDQIPILKDLSFSYLCSCEATEEEKVKHIQITYTTKSNQERTVLVACEILEINGSTQFLVVCMDITKQQQYEEEIFKLDRLHTIGQVASAIAHEVRNPLTTIKGFTQLFSIKPEFLPYKNHLELVVSEIDRANEIISDFLSLTKTCKPNKEDSSVIDEIKEVLPLIHAYALEEDVTIKTTFQNVPNVLISKSEFRQVLLNIVKNAIEVSEDGNAVTISTYEEDSQVIVSIADQGAGIPEEIKGKVGEPFYTTKENGTGLGLAVCNTILRRHSGSMDFKTSNKGTIFYLRFPITISELPA